MITSFLSDEELRQIGFQSVGENVRISRKASFYGASKMIIGNNVRIDDFSGHIKLGNNIHISAYVALYGAEGIELQDYTGISPRSTIYSAMDDFSGDYLIGPIHPDNTTNVTGGKVTLERYVQIGCNCVVFPAVTISEGSVIGAMSLVNKTTQPWTINYGVPCKAVHSRNRELLKLLY